MSKQPFIGSTTSAALLLSGTCIGAGMLGMPLATGSAGFWPGVVANFLCWLCMVLTGLLFLEATLWMPDGSNVLSMAERFLGSWGRWMAGGAFVFLYYCLLTAYVAGGAPLVGQAAANIFSTPPPDFLSALLFTSAIGLVLFLGTRTIDRVNWILMTGLILSYILLVVIGSEQVEAYNLQVQQWPLLFASLPVLFTSYGFHNVIPSLTSYLGRKEKNMRYAIIFGSFFTFVVFVVWQGIIIGILGEKGIEKGLASGLPVTETLSTLKKGLLVAKIGNFFGFFALITSFLGVGLSVIDFLGDGLKIPHRMGKNRVFLTLATLLPPFAMAGTNPEIFYQAIGLAGGFGEAFLNGFLPVALVWIGRYRKGLSSEWQLPGGKVMLVLILIATSLVALLEVYHLCS